MFSIDYYCRFSLRLLRAGVCLFVFGLLAGCGGGGGGGVSVGLPPVEPPASSLTITPPHVDLPAFRVGFHSALITAAAQEASVRGAAHTAVVQINNEDSGSIAIGREAASYLSIAGVGLGDFASTLAGGAGQSLTLRGTGASPAVRRLTVFSSFPVTSESVTMVTQTGGEKALRLIAGDGGSLLMSVMLYNYNSSSYVLDLTPSSLSLAYRLPGGSVTSEAVQISALLVDIAGREDSALLLEARYAAFGLNFDYAVSGTARLTNFFRYGAETSADALNRMLAASAIGGGAGTWQFNYIIPRHSAKGYYENQTTPQLGRFLSNKETGTLAMNFRTTLATLNLKLHAFANTMSGASLLATAAHLGDEFVSFSNFALGSWVTLSAGIGNSNCQLAGGSVSNNTTCGGVFALAGVVTVTNQATTAGSDLDVNVRFYGERAQEIAGFARYISAGHVVRLGFLGINAFGGVGAPKVAATAVSYTALSWSSAAPGGSSLTVETNASGAPVSLLVGTNTRAAFGAAASSGYVYRYFRGTLGAALRANAKGVVISETSDSTSSIVLTVANAVVTHSAASNTNTRTSDFGVQTYRSADGSAFSYAVSAEGAAFFYLFDKQDLRQVRHGFYGVQTPLWAMNILRRAKFQGAYTIPAGAAQGLAWNADKGSDYFLYNKQAGALGVDFGNSQATLAIAVGAADKDGTYTENFLQIRDFRMAIRGNVFNNYHCTGATRTAGTACEGALTFTNSYLADYDGSAGTVPANSVRVHAGGAFYGEGAPKAVAGGIAYYVGDSSQQGMRLQFLGANPWYGTLSAVITATLDATLAPLPLVTLPPADLPTFRVGFGTALITGAAQEGRVRGAVHAAVVQIGSESGSPDITVSRSTDSSSYLRISTAVVGYFESTLSGGAAQPLTLRGTGAVDVEYEFTEYYNFPAVTQSVISTTHIGGDNVLHLVAGNGGSLLISIANLINYNTVPYLLDLTPSSLSIAYRMPGIADPGHLLVQMSAVIPNLGDSTEDSALLMEARYAAFGLNFNYAASGTPRLTNFFRYGAHTSADALRRIAAASASGGSASKWQFNYIIPRHAAKGYYENQVSPQLGKFLSNKDSGTLAMDFRAIRATLNLTLHAFGNTMTGTALLTNAADLGDEMVSFSNFALGGTLASGVGNAACRSAGGSVTANCGGTFSIADIVNLNNNAAAGSSGTIAVNVRFYGARAQEIAGFARYTSAGHIVRLGFLGVNEFGGVAAPNAAARATSYTAFTWDSAGAGASTLTVQTNSSGTPLHLVTASNASVGFGAAATSGYNYRYFRGNLGAVLRASDGGIVVGNNTRATLGVSNASVDNPDADGTGSRESAFSVKTYRSAGSDPASGTLSYVVSAEDASFFYIFDGSDLRQVRHGFYGAQTPLWAMSVLHGAKFRGAYTIPAGAAQGLAWNSSNDKDYFLRNKAAGTLGVDFGELQVSLNITVDAVDKDGAYSNGFLAITDFQMSIRGNVFSNYHCTGATRTGNTACPGTLTFANGYLATYNGNTTAAPAGNLRVHAGGAFYGEGAPKAVAGGIAYYAGNSSAQGMRLQFLGANPWYGTLSAGIAATMDGALAALPPAGVPDANLSDYEIVLAPTPHVAEAVAEAKVPGGRFTDAIHELSGGGTVDRRSGQPNLIRVGGTDYSFNNTIISGSVGVLLDRSELNTPRTHRIIQYYDFPEVHQSTITYTVVRGLTQYFVPKAGGGLGLIATLNNYNRALYTIDVSPSDVVLSASVAGITHTVSNVRLSGALLRSTSGRSFWLVESDYAAFALNFRLSATYSPITRYGHLTPAGNLAAMKSAAFAGIYHIPRHAAQGTHHQHNSSAIGVGRFVSNPGAGHLGVDFGGGTATLNLTLHAYYDNATGSSLLTNPAHIGGAVIADFSNFILRGFDITSTASGGRGISNLSCASNTGANAGTTACGGQVTYAGGVIRNNVGGTSHDVEIHTGFYGAHAQQIAGYIKLFRGDNRLYAGFLGVESGGGFNSGSAPLGGGRQYTALTWDSADHDSSNDYTVSLTAGGSAPQVLSSGTVTHQFGAAATDGYTYHHFRNLLGAALRARDNGMQVHPGQVLSVPAGVMATRDSKTYSVKFSAKTYRHTLGTTLTTFSQVVSAEHAAFFYTFGHNIRTARHAFYGAQTPLRVADALETAGLEATYTIPAGAAQGVFWNGATDTATNVATYDYFLYNKRAGELGVDFGESQATLGITVGAVNVEGTYSEGFLAIVNFQMTIRGNVFNNYHCRAALTTRNVDCTGTFTYHSSAGSGVDFNASADATALGNVRVRAGGAFYGASAQEAAGAIAHLFGDAARKTGGMRLQWIGANPTISVNTQLVTLPAPAPDDLPSGTVHPIALPAFQVGFRPTLITDAPQQASLRGATYDAVAQINNENSGSIAIARTPTSNYLNIGSVSIGTFGATLGGGAAQQITLRGTGNTDAVRDIIVRTNFPGPQHEQMTERVTQTGNFKVLRLIAGNNGSLGIAVNLYNYNKTPLTLDITPSSMALEYRMPGVNGAVAKMPVQISAIIPNINSTTDTALLMEARYAAFGLNFNHNAASGTPRLTNFFRYGRDTTQEQMARMAAAYTRPSYRYIIPRHAARGYYENQTSPQASRFLSNNKPGSVVLYFDQSAGTVAHIRLTLQGFGNTVSGDRLPTNAVELGQTGGDLVVFNRFAMSYWEAGEGTLTAGLGNSGCLAAGGSSGHNVRCQQGTFIIAGIATVTGNATPASGGRFNMNIRFYGDRAQEIAGFARYTSAGHVVRLGFLGIHSKGGMQAPKNAAAAASYTALTWDSAAAAASSLTVQTNSSGDPVSLVTGASATSAFGATATSGFALRYFRNNLGVVLRANVSGVVVGDTPTITFVVADATVTQPGGTSTSVSDFSVQTHRSADRSAFSYVVSAEDASFFYIFDNTDIRQAKHGFYGVQAPLWGMAILNSANFQGRYTIPAGAAQGLAWNSSRSSDYLLYNRQAGVLGADFGSVQVTLDLTVGAVDRDGAYTEDFAKIKGFRMTMRGNAFNNYHCTAATHTGSTACTGEIEFALARLLDTSLASDSTVRYLENFDANEDSASDYGQQRVHAGGAFYGEGAPKAVAGGIAYYVGASSAQGMRLQFLGANPWYGTLSAAITDIADGAQPDLPSPTMPDASLSDFEVGFRSALITGTAQERFLRGGIYTAVAQIANEGNANIVISRAASGYLNIGGTKVVDITGTLSGGAVVLLTLRGTGSAEFVRTLTLHSNFPITSTSEHTVTQTGAFKELRLIAGDGGSLGMSVFLYNFNTISYTLDLTPSSITLAYTLPGAPTLLVPVQISAVIPTLSGTEDSALLMEARYAAFGFNFNYAASGTPRLTNFFRYGVPTPGIVFRNAGLSSRPSYRYVIPPHAAKGYYENETSPQASRFLSNKEAGVFNLRLSENYAVLNLKMHAYAPIMSGGTLLASVAHLGEEILEIRDIRLLRSAGSFLNGAGNQGCRLATPASDNLSARHCTEGTFTFNGLRLDGGVGRAGHSGNIHARMYGERAQEVAGFVRYTAPGQVVRFGFLGINRLGGITAAKPGGDYVWSGSYAAFTWDSAAPGGSTLTVYENTNGVPVNLATGDSATSAFGATATSGYALRYFRNNLGIVLRANVSGVVVSDAGTLTLSVQQSVTVTHPAASNTSTSVSEFSVKTHRRADGSAFSYVVSAEDAAFFYIFDNTDIRQAKHGFYGVQTPLSAMTILQSANFQGKYTIPVGGAQGMAWNSSKAKDYLLHNKEEGALGVHFGALSVALSITVAAVDRDGTYTDDFLQVTDFRMTIRGNVFNNYHCTGASHSANASCTGKLEFAADYLAEYNAAIVAAPASGMRVHAGGAFFGEGLPRAVAGGIAYYVGTSSAQGMRLQFLGANPWYGPFAAVITATTRLTQTLPDTAISNVVLSDYEIALAATPHVASAAAEAKVAGGRFTDVIYGLAATGTVDRRSGQTNNIVIGTRTHDIAATVVSGSVSIQMDAHVVDGSPTTYRGVQYHNFPAVFQRNFIYTINSRGLTQSFAPKAGGGLGVIVTLNNYNAARYTIDVSPADVMLSATVAGFTDIIVTNVRVSGALLTASDKRQFWLVESDYAAFGLNFAWNAGSGNSDIAAISRYGHQTPAANLAAMKSAALAGAYHIPRHAAQGNHHHRLKVGFGRFVSNPGAGHLGVDFGGGTATLNLTLHAYYDNVTGPSLLTDKAHISGTVIADFKDFILRGFEIESNTHGARGISNLSCASNTGTGGGSETNAARCGGQVTYAGDVIRNNAGGTAHDVEIHTGFYGAHAQQIAGYIRLIRSGTNANLHSTLYVGFLGVESGGGFNPGSVHLGGGRQYTALTWDSADHDSTNDHTVSLAAGSSHAPQALSKGGTTYQFGAAVDDGYSFHHFRNALGLALYATPSGMRVHSGQVFSVAASVVATRDTKEYKTEFNAKSYRRVNAGVTTFSQVVFAEHAAFFYMFGQNIRTARHAFYGAQTPLRVADVLKAAGLEATYTIPVGAAQGIFWNGATDTATNAVTRDYFLYNRDAGELGVDFGESQAILHITVGSVDKEGAYTASFLNVADFQMAIRGNVFNNYHCRAALPSQDVNCTGTFTYAAAAAAGGTNINFTASADAAALGNVRVRAGGAFYGGSAQEAAGAIAHLFGDSARKTGGMRLQWLAANPTIAVSTQLVAPSAPTPDDLPIIKVPDANLSDYTIPLAATPHTAEAAAEAKVAGGRFTDVIYGLAATATIDRRSGPRQRVVIDGSDHEITVTVFAGSVVGVWLDAIEVTDSRNYTFTQYWNFPETHTRTITYTAPATEWLQYLAPRAGGALGFIVSLQNYNGARYTIDLTPADVTLSAGAAGAATALSTAVRLSGALLIGEDNRQFWLVESDYAAFGLHFPWIQSFGPRVAANISRYGHQTPTANLAAMKAAAFSARYHIPRHAAQGFHSISDRAHAGAGRFVSNPAAGRMDMHFGGGRATLNLVLHAYYDNVIGTSLLASPADITASVIANFEDFVLRGFDATATAFASLGVSNLGCASNTGGSDAGRETDATICGGKVTYHGAPISNNVGGGHDVEVLAGFYGAHAQQIAGYIKISHAQNNLNVGFLGVESGGGFNPGTLSLAAGGQQYAALTWDSADHDSTNDYTVSLAAGSSAAPQALSKGGTVHQFGAAVDDGYSFHHFRNALGLALYATPSGMRVHSGQVFSVAASVVATRDTKEYKTEFNAKSYRRVNAGVTTFSQVVSAEHAAFFYMFGENLRTARHAFYGAQTPLRVADALKAAGLEATYTIPVGAAQGMFWHGATDTATNAVTYDYFLYNRDAGELGVDFGESQAILHITVGRVNKDGAYTASFLNIADFQMAIRGNVFNNYHCRAALPTRNVDCTGTFTYAAAAAAGGTNINFTASADAAALGNVRVRAGGAFYGGSAQEAAGAIAHLFGDSARKTGGMRLQWIGANPTIAVSTQLVASSAPAPDALPPGTVHPIALPAFQVGFRPALITDAPQQARLRGATYDAVAQINNEGNGSIAIARTPTSNYLNIGSVSIGLFGATLGGGAAQQLTLRGTGNTDAVRTIVVHTNFPGPQAERHTTTVTQTGSFKVLRLIAGDSGSLGIAVNLYNYNKIPFTLDITPSSLALEYRMPGVNGSVAKMPVQISAIIPNINSTTDTALLMEARYAAFGLNFNHHDGTSGTPRLTNFFRYGVDTTQEQMARMAAAYKAPPYEYIIPRHAARGYYENLASPQASRFLSNNNPGTVVLQFNSLGTIAYIRLTLQGFGNTVSGGKLPINAVELGQTGGDLVAINNFALVHWEAGEGILTAGIGNSQCRAAGGTSDSVIACQPNTFIIAGIAAVTNNATPADGGRFNMNIRFYGDRAQEIAGFARYTSNSHIVRLGFLGIHSKGGMNAPKDADAAASYTALTWDSAAAAASSLTVQTNSSGDPVSLVTGASATSAFGATATSGFAIRYFRNNLGVVLRANVSGVVVGDTPTITFVVADAAVTQPGGTSTSVSDFSVQTYRSADRSAFSYVVSAEDASFFYIFDNTDIRQAKHGFYGVQAPLWGMAILNSANFQGKYTIPAGAAQGLAWNRGRSSDYLLYNRQAGMLGADFGSVQVTLDLTVGAVDRDGAYTEDFAKIKGFRMTMRGNAFNNYHCTAASHTGSTACSGQIEFALARLLDTSLAADSTVRYLENFDSSEDSASDYAQRRVHAGGAFYGEGAPKAVAGGVAYYVGASSAQGMRLQFLGANPWYGTLSAAITDIADGAQPDLPSPTMPDANLPSFQMSFRPALITGAAAEARVRGAVHAAVVQINGENSHHITIARTAASNYLNISAASIGNFAGTLGGGTGKDLTLRGTGSNAAEIVITKHSNFPTVASATLTLTQSGAFKALRLIAGDGGSLGISVNLYDFNEFSYVLDLTPSNLSLEYRLPDGSLVGMPAQISAIIPTITGKDDTALLMEARYAAFGLNLNYHAVNTGTPRLTNFFRYGAQTSESALNRIAAAANAGSAGQWTFNYIIPRHAAKGYYENQTTPQLGRFLSNKNAGVLTMNFRTLRAMLGLTLQAFANTMSGGSLLVTGAHLGQDFVTFTDFALGHWGTVTTGIGNSTCTAASGDGSDTDSTRCAGVFTIAGIATATNAATPDGGGKIDVNVRFYGARAQEIAGFARYTSAGHIVRLGFLGVNAFGGVGAPKVAAAATSYTALSWDSAAPGGSSLTVQTNASGAPINLITGTNATSAFGAAASSGYVFRYFRNALGVVLRASHGGMVVGTNGELTLGVSNAVVANPDASGSGSRTSDFSVQTYRRADGSALSYVVSAEDAAYFYIFDNTDIRRTRHGFYGVQAPLAGMSVLQSAEFQGAYTIPIGAAQGFAWNSGKTSDYFLRNRAAGVLSVNFEDMQVTLNITVDAADKDGTYTDNFLEVTDFQMAIRGNVFNNYHCTGASYAENNACAGRLEFAADYLADYDASATSTAALNSVRVHAGGAFYGEGLPKAVAGGIAYYEATNREKGMRLQFLGANPWYGTLSVAITATLDGALASLPALAAPAIALPTFRVDFRSALITAAAQEGGVRNAAHTAVVQINNEDRGNIAIGRGAAHYLNIGGASLGVFLATLGGNAVQPLTLRGTGTMDAVIELTLHSTVSAPSEILTLTQTGGIKTFNLIANTIAGVIGISIKLYNYGGREWGLTLAPGTVTLLHGLPGGVFAELVRVDAIMPDITNTDDTALLMEARYAAFGLNFNYEANSAATARLTNFFRYGTETSADALQRMRASAGDAAVWRFNYIIPRHVAKGYYENQTTPQLGRFLNNKTEGTLQMDFRSTLARLHLTMHAFANSMSGPSLLTDLEHLGDDFITFKDFALGYWDTISAGIGNSGCTAAIGDGSGTDATLCGGVVTIAGIATITNAASAGSGNALDVNVRFYGDRAQEMAGFARYTSAEHIVRFGFLGINEFGFVPALPPASPTASASYAALSWDSAAPGGGALTVRTDASGAPVSLLLGGGNRAAFGAAANSGHTYRYFRGTLGAALIASPGGMVVAGGGGSLALGVHNATFTLHSGAVSSIDFSADTYRSADGAVFSYVVSGGGAAFFAIMDSQDIRKARHGFFGVRTPLSGVTILRVATVHAVYTIPAGGAQGFVWNSSKAEDYFLHNKAAGMLGVDFRNLQVSLNLTVDAVDKDGAYVDGFLKVTDFRMMLRGNVFNNYHCTGASYAENNACIGRIVFTPSGYLADYNANITATSGLNGVRVHAGGAFYGEGVPVAVAGGIAYYVGDDSENGMRLQFIGAGAVPVMATKADGSAVPAAQLSILISAEHAAFAASGSGGDLRMAHYGTTRTAPATLATMAAAVYRIAANKARGIFSDAGAAEHTLSNTAPGQLRVDFRNTVATLGLTVQASTHSYGIDDLVLQIRSNGFRFCTGCAGSISAAGDLLNVFTDTSNLQVNGAFYGGGAEQAAGVLRHTSSGGGKALDLGFIGEKE